MGGVGHHCVETRISQCSACETPLPLCEAADPEQIRVWLCSHCGIEFRAMLAQDYTIDELRGVRPEAVTLDSSMLRPVTPEMLAFAQQLNSRIDTKVEKRSSTRHAAIATLKALELDEQLRPVGCPFHTICRNLSTGGICLINDRAIRSKFLLIELSAAPGTSIQTLAHVLRQRPLGPYHDIGSEFVTKLANPSPEMARS